MAFSTDSRTTDQVYMTPWLTSFFHQWEPGLINNLNAKKRGKIRCEKISVKSENQGIYYVGRNSGNNIDGRGNAKKKKQLYRTIKLPTHNDTMHCLLFTLCQVGMVIVCTDVLKWY